LFQNQYHEKQSYPIEVIVSILQNHLIIYLNIRPGSGKTAMINTLVSEMMEEKEIVEAQKWVLFIDVKSCVTNLQKLWNKINSFAERKLERTLEYIGYRIIVIDNIDVINPALQQGAVY
jgi:DNA replication protein DnaC